MIPCLCRQVYIRFMKCSMASRIKEYTHCQLLQPEESVLLNIFLTYYCFGQQQSCMHCLRWWRSYSLHCVIWYICTRKWSRYTSMGLKSTRKTVCGWKRIAGLHWTKQQTDWPTCQRIRSELGSEVMQQTHGLVDQKCNFNNFGIFWFRTVKCS